MMSTDRVMPVKSELGNKTNAEKKNHSEEE